MSSLHPIDLFQGRPAPELLPTEHLKNAAIKALSDETISDPGLGYGPDEGYYPLRQNIASWLSGVYATSQPINVDRICITGGASQNLSTILQVFTDPLQTRIIWLVEPTYHLVFRNFEDAGFHGRMRGIPEDEEGMDANALERALELFEEEEAICDTKKVSILPSYDLRVILKANCNKDNETTQVISQNIQAHHLLRSKLLKSLGNYYDRLTP